MENYQQQLLGVMQEGLQQAQNGIQIAFSSASALLQSVKNSSLADNMPSTMPSLRSIATLAFTFAGSAFLAPQDNAVRAGHFDVCPSPGQLSCHNTTVVENTCCFVSPGGQLLQTQFWDTSPATGPTTSWTVHGLWPDLCDGSYQSSCDPSRAYTNISAILKSYGATSLLAYMNEYWLNDPNDGTNEEFWEHEWEKHGTCISTFDTKCYTGYTPGEEVVDFFNTTVNLFQTLPSYQFLSKAGILPSSSKTYTSAEILDALQTARGVSANIQCSDGALDEIWYFFDIRGPVQTGTFVPANPVGSSSDCPATGVKYLPK